MDRRLRERGIALSQRLRINESRVRSLQLRAYPGAVRTAAVENYTPSSPSSWTSAVQATVSAGRWMIIGHTAISAVPTDWEIFGMRFGVTDPSSGLDVAGEMTVFDNPIMWESMVEPTGGGTHWVTLMDTCDLVNPFDQVTVALQVINAGSTTPFNAVRARLRMIPV